MYTSASPISMQKQVPTCRTRVFSSPNSQDSLALVLSGLAQYTAFPSVDVKGNNTDPAQISPLDFVLFFSSYILFFFFLSLFFSFFFFSFSLSLFFSFFFSSSFFNILCLRKAFTILLFI